MIAVLIFPASGQGPNREEWQIGPFTRPASGNPVISPNPESVFQDPIRNAPVHWEALHTFNPAAVVREGRIDVLYRAEDNTGAMRIGMHTSRLGLAESTDGIHFTRQSTPVFYPAQDRDCFNDRADDLSTILLSVSAKCIHEGSHAMIFS